MPPTEEDQSPHVVLITAPDADVARRLARRLVETSLAACVNVVPGITSVYRWEGSVHEDPEVLLVAKTRASRLPAIEALLADEHPYDVPECVALAADRVEERYRRWLVDQTG